MCLEIIKMTLLYCADINILIIKPRALFANCNVNILTFRDTDRFLRYKFNDLYLSMTKKS